MNYLAYGVLFQCGLVLGYCLERSVVIWLALLTCFTTWAQAVGVAFDAQAGKKRFAESLNQEGFARGDCLVWAALIASAVSW